MERAQFDMENRYHIEFLRPGSIMTKEKWYDKLDLLLAIATCSIGFEYIPVYFGIDLKNFTIAWFLMPPLLLLSFTLNIKEIFVGGHNQMESYLSTSPNFVRPFS